MKIDICIVTETKKKLKDTIDFKVYILFYTGVFQNKKSNIRSVKSVNTITGEIEYIVTTS
jgi:hypothetical protein